MQYKYSCPDAGEGFEDAAQFENAYRPEDVNLLWVAEHAAELYHHAGGYEESLWPLVIDLWTGGKALGRFSVERECVPTFHATKVT